MWGEGGFPICKLYSVCREIRLVFIVVLSPKHPAKRQRYGYDGVLTKPEMRSLSK